MMGYIACLIALIMTGLCVVLAWMAVGRHERKDDSCDDEPELGHYAEHAVNAYYDKVWGTGRHKQ